MMAQFANGGYEIKPRIIDNKQSLQPIVDAWRGEFISRKYNLDITVPGLKKLFRNKRKDEEGRRDVYDINMHTGRTSVQGGKEADVRWNTNVLLYLILTGVIRLIGLEKRNKPKEESIQSEEDIFDQYLTIQVFEDNHLKKSNWQGGKIEEIRSFLRQKMYNNKNVLTKNNNGKKIVKKLYSLISKKPNKFLTREQLKEDKTRAISDFISGMTDRYAINLHKKIK